MNAFLLFKSLQYYCVVGLVDLSPPCGNTIPTLWQHYPHLVATLSPPCGNTIHTL
jgi:hypothetical protein